MTSYTHPRSFENSCAKESRCQVLEALLASSSGDGVDRLGSECECNGEGRAPVPVVVVSLLVGVVVGVVLLLVLLLVVLLFVVLSMVLLMPMGQGVDRGTGIAVSP